MHLNSGLSPLFRFFLRLSYFPIHIADETLSVDNYQGEESDIIIGSFVRSNESGSMGFIGDPNRLNVAISRARSALQSV